MLKIAFIALALCIAAGIALVLFWRSTAPAPALPTAKANVPVYGDMRNLALTITRGELGIVGAYAEDQPWGVLMETGFPEGTAIVVSMADGSASLYLSGGGGVVGGIGDEKIRSASATFVELAGQLKANMTPTKTFPLPREGRTVFYVRTDLGVITAEADEEELGEERHKLSPLFHAGHEVIAQLRFASAK
jgi:hypothetical protein